MIPTIRERAGHSRRHVTLTTDRVLSGGTVLGKLAEGSFAEWDPEADDGRQVASAVLLVRADPGDGFLDLMVVVRDCEVDETLLKFNPSGSPTEDEIDQAKADLAATGVTMQLGESTDG